MAKKEQPKAGSKKAEPAKDVVNIEKKKGERVSINSGLNFHDFTAEPEFVGKYVREQWADVLNKETKQSEHKVIGYVFVNEEDEEILVGNSHQIEKALNTNVNGVPAKENGDFVWYITFTGQKELDGGRKVNQFKIEVE